MARHNVVGTGAMSDLSGDIYLAMDTLPRPIRRVLHQATVTFDPRRAKQMLRNSARAGINLDDAIQAVIDAIRAAEAAELQAFASSVAGDASRYPHVAAKVTILRDQEATP